MNTESFCKIFIEGPQGSGKSLLAEHISKSIGCELTRGIPTGEELKSLSNKEIWIATKEIANLPGSRVYDRSLLSLISYNIKKKPKFEDFLYSLGSRQIIQISNKNMALWVFIESDVNTCWERQLEGVHSIDSFKSMEEEVSVYGSLYSKLEKSGNNLNLIKVRNGKDVEVIEFLEHSMEEIYPRINYK